MLYMHAIPQVWVISRHYKDDQQMEPLMGRIAWEIANKIASLINVRTIFRESITGSIKLISESQAVLLKWEKSYMHMRHTIEESGRDNRCVCVPAWFVPTDARCASG